MFVTAVVIHSLLQPLYIGHGDMSGSQMPDTMPINS